MTFNRRFNWEAPFPSTSSPPPPNQVLSRIELVNNLVALLSIDFHALETDARKEMQQIR